MLTCENDNCRQDLLNGECEVELTAVLRSTDGAVYDMSSRVWYRPPIVKVRCLACGHRWTVKLEPVRYELLMHIGEYAAKESDELRALHELRRARQATAQVIELNAWPS